MRRAVLLVAFVVTLGRSLLLPSANAYAASAPVGIITTVAGDGERRDFQPGPALKASLQQPTGVIVGSDGSLYIADFRGDRVRKVNPTGIISTVAGLLTKAELAGDLKAGAVIVSRMPDPNEPAVIEDGLLATRIKLDHPFGVALGIDGSLYFSDVDHHRVCKVDPAGMITTVAGIGSGGVRQPGRRGGNRRSPSEGGLATETRLRSPQAVAVGPDGSLYIAETESNWVRKVDPKGITNRVAGIGRIDLLNEGGRANEASLNAPQGVAVAVDGTVYIADTGSDRVRKVDPKGIITTVAGGGFAVDGENGDGKPATRASLNKPVGIALAPDGSLFIAEQGSHCIRKVDPQGIITTVAGTGLPGFSGDGGPATSATLNEPTGLAIGPDGSLYVADTGNKRIRKITW